MRVGLGFLLCLLFVARFSNADDQTVDIVGAAECADCQLNNFKTSQAFSGLHVTIDCKLKTGEIKRVGDGELDEGGEFKISLLKEIIKDGKNLKKECYAQLHNAAAAPCPAHDGLDNTKIVIKSQTHDKITFTPTKTLRFSTALCTSKFLWPFFEYPPLPKFDPWKKKWPKFTIPPLKNFGQPWILPPPYKPIPKPPIVKPIPPVYKPIPKPPLVKPLPPVVKPLPPIYKPIPKPPIVKPLPPIYKPIPKPPIVKPLPPIYKPIPKPPVVKPLPPIYKPIPKPPIVKPLPPIYKPIPKPPVVKPLPPIYKPIPKPPVVKPFPPAVPIYKPLPPPVPIYEPPIVKPLPPPVPIYEPPVVTKPLPPPFPLFPLPPLPPLPPLHKKPCPPITKILPKLKHPKFGYFPKLPPFNSNP